jgi:CBS domain-containing protein
MRFGFRNAGNGLPFGRLKIRFIFKNDWYFGAFSLMSESEVQLTRSAGHPIISVFIHSTDRRAQTFAVATLQFSRVKWSPLMNTFSALLAQDVMSSPVFSTSPESSVDQLELEFVRHSVSAMPVVQHRQIVGIISRSDLMLLPVLSAAIDSCAISAGMSVQPKATFRVCDLMNRDVVQCSPATELRLVAADMVQRHVHHVVVVQNNEPVGIISSLDIVKLTL